MTVLTVEFFYDNTHEVKKQDIQTGFMIVPTDEGKFVVIHFTIDGTYAEEYEDVKELIEEVKESYGEDMAKIVEEEFEDYFTD